MKRLALFLSLSLLLSSCSTYLWKDPNLCKAWWLTEINQAFVAKVKADLTRVQENGCKVIQVEVFSPGGSVVSTFEVVRLMQEARQKGLIIETYGRAMVASGATFVLAAGTPGHRYVGRHTFVLIHAPKRGWGVVECITYVENPTTEDAKIENIIIDKMAEIYSELSGRPFSATKTWVTCGQEQAGGGELLIRLGLADALSLP